MKSYRFISLLVCILLGALLLVSYRCSSWWPFASSNTSPTSPKTIQGAPSDVAQHAITILCLGDSLTEGYGIAEEQAYPALLEKRFAEEGFHQVRLINAGVSGSTSASALKRLEWHLQHEPKPQILFLALGANDGLRGLSTTNLQQNLSETIAKAQEAGLVVILAGMKIPMNFGPAYTSAFEKVYDDLVKQYDLIFIPFLLEGVALNPELNLSDGIHPNAQGHEIITGTVFPILRDTVKSLGK